MKGLNKARVVTLTVDPDYFFEVCPPPDWWELHKNAWCTLCMNVAYQHWLRALREYCRRKDGYEWSFIVGVLEFQESGMPHYHVVFYGHKFPVNKAYELWGWSQRQAYDAERFEWNTDEYGEFSPADYLAGYMGKQKRAIEKNVSGEGDTDYGKLDSLAVCWYWRLRWFRVRVGGAPSHQDTGEWQWLGERNRFGDLEVYRDLPEYCERVNDRVIAVETQSELPGSYLG